MYIWYIHICTQCTHIMYTYYIHTHIYMYMIYTDSIQTMLSSHRKPSRPPTLAKLTGQHTASKMSTVKTSQQLSKAFYYVVTVSQRDERWDNVIKRFSLCRCSLITPASWWNSIQGEPVLFQVQAKLQRMDLCVAIIVSPAPPCVFLHVTCGSPMP